MKHHTNISKLRACSSLLICLLLAACAGPTSDAGARNLHRQWAATHPNGVLPWAGFENTKAGRTEFIQQYLSVKDYEYENYKHNLRRSTSYGGFGSDAVTIGLNTAAALTGGAPTKAALSGIAGAITGASASFRKNVLFDQSITTFITKMDALRLTRLKIIEDKLDKDTAVYPLSAAYRDIEYYAHAGTLEAALVDIDVKAGVEKADLLKKISTQTPHVPGT
jgi:hypothetical protein